MARRFAFARIARLGAVAAALVAGSFALGASPASAETRTLDLYYVHTGERAQITFKKNGRYDPAALKRLNVMLRDWRRNEPTRMDPALFDLVWEVWKESGSRKPITVTSAYRSPQTNNMLRRRTRGVAKNSQHTYGRAMDWFVTDVPTSKLRVIALRKQIGGVGYYPTSRTPFVHTDTGSVRHWPRMSRSQLIAVFPNGRTLHVPTDGKPLPGYEQAAADYLRRKKGLRVATSTSGGRGAVASFGRGDGIIRPPAGASKSLLAALFGGGADEEEDSVDSTGAVGAGGGDEDDSPAPAKAKAAPAVAVARAPSVINARELPSSTLPGVNVEADDAPAKAKSPAKPAAVVTAPPPPPPAPAAPKADPVGELLVANADVPANKAPAAVVASALPPKAKPDDAPQAVPVETVAATVTALRVPVPAPGREPGSVAIAVASTAPPRPKPADLVVASAALTPGDVAPVLGYAAGPAAYGNGPVDVFAETAASLRGNNTTPPMRGSATASRAVPSEEAMPGASELGIAPLAGLTVAASDDPFVDELTAPDRAEPLLLSNAMTVRAMDFAKLSAPDCRRVPAIIAAVDLPGTNSLYAGIVPGPRTDRFAPDLGDQVITVASR